jgi:hypothetical protein
LAEFDASCELSTQYHFSAWLSLASLLQGAVRAALTHDEEALEQSRNALSDYRQAMIGTVPLCQSIFADACYRMGHLEESLTVIESTLELVETHNERTVEASLYRLKGDLLMQQSGNSPSQALADTLSAISAPEDYFHKALEVAHRQEAKSLELQAAIRLASHWIDQGRDADARDLLRPIYDWFTEGFDTADLREAKRLLDVLSE